MTVSVSGGTTTDDPAPSGRPIFDVAAGALVDDAGADIAAVSMPSMSRTVRL